MAGTLTIDEALAAVLGRAAPLGSETVPLAELRGRVLAGDAVAAVDLPSFRSSAMDGFAVRSEDTPGLLPVVDRIPAGRPAAGSLEPGTAMGIATGGVVPDGADAVVPIERVVEVADRIELAERAEPGAHVRPVGGDVRAGELVVSAGTLLGPAQIGALGAAGIGSAACAARPRVAVVSTGTELRPPGEPLGPGQIYESNGAMLAAALESVGALVERIAPVEDDEAAHREALERALGADVLVTSGGVSVGPHDLVRQIERELGVEEVFWGVAVKPGKPLAFGVRGRTLVFGLPGNPVSSLVGMLLFVRPAILALQGAAEPGPSFDVAALARAVTRNPSRDELIRAVARADGDGTALDPVSGQESHMIARAAGANALALVPAGSGELAAGAPVRYLRLDA